MTVRVITPPAPIVTPAEIAGSNGPDDAMVAALIQAVTEEIDGPTGCVGRSFGPQTLEMILPGFVCGRNLLLPFRPIIGIVSVKYLDSHGSEQTVAASEYRLADDRVWFAAGFAFPSVTCAPDAVRIRYKAGYNGTAGAADGEVQTGKIPERARQAIILSVQHLKALGAENLFLRSEEVEGVGSRQWTVSDQASQIIHQAADRLLATLRVYA